MLYHVQRQGWEKEFAKSIKKDYIGSRNGEVSSGDREKERDRERDKERDRDKERQKQRKRERERGGEWTNLFLHTICLHMFGFGGIVDGLHSSFWVLVIAHSILAILQVWHSSASQSSLPLVSQANYTALFRSAYVLRYSINNEVCTCILHDY